MNFTKVLPLILKYSSNSNLTKFTRVHQYHRKISSIDCICSCKLKKQIVTSYRHYSKENADKIDEPSTRHNYAGLTKYKLFEDHDLPAILDVDEERKLRLENPELFEIEEEKVDELAHMNLERGVNGVFEVEELVEILRNENARYIVVLKIPEECQYADHMVIVSGKSYKHIFVMAEYIRKLFKRKRYETDDIPRIEGIKRDGKSNDSEWLALDMGNIILHLFLHRTRLHFDLETLWAVGPEYDDQCNAKDNEYISSLMEHTHPALQGLEAMDFEMSEDKDQLG